MDFPQRVGYMHALEGERPGSLIIHVQDGYFYHIHHNEATNWFISLRCVHRNRLKCRGRAGISRDGMQYTITQHHTHHVPDAFFAEEMELRRRILRRCTTADPTPFKQIVMEEGQRGAFSVEARSRVTVARMRTAMSNVRMSNLPRVPRNLAVLGAILSDPHFEHLTATIDGQDNIFAGYCGMMCEGTLSVVFASRRMLLFVERQQKAFADGTFKKRPKKPTTSQIFNISYTWENHRTRLKHTIVGVRAFMQRRTEQAYSVLFQFLKHLMPQWQPVLIMCDHERGQVNAWLRQFPQSRVVTCLWHYAVDVYRYAKSLRLQALMEVNQVVYSIVRCCCVLPLLPNYLIAQGLQDLVLWSRWTGSLRYPAVRALLAYIHREWVSNRVEYLSVCGCEDRTNNVSESVNAVLSWELRQDRPYVFEVTRAFIRQEDQFNVDIHALRRGINPGRLNATTSLAKDVRIQNLTVSLLTNRLSILEFLLGASETYNAAYNFVFQP